ncbi:MAG TPA: hypothetical protein VKS79_22620 [Gemmataceae bacterium]|nr:hypothetical protein [Gemmataceae bacterium]
MPLYLLLMLLSNDVREEFIKRSHDPYQILCIRSLTDSSSHRKDAADALVALNPHNAVAPVRLAMHLSRDARERAFLARLLLELGHSDKRVLAAMQELFESDETETEWLRLRREMEFRGPLGERAAPLTSALARRIKHCDSTRGGEESSFLIGSGKADGQAISAVVALLKRSCANNSQRAETNCLLIVLALQLTGPQAKDAIPTLETMLKDKSTFLAAHAAAALTVISPGHRGAADFVKNIAGGSSDSTRWALGAVLAYSKMHEDLRIAGAKSILEDPASNADDLWLAFQCLAAIGTHAKSIAPLAKRYLQHKDAIVQIHAATALCAMDQAEEKAGVAVLLAALKGNDPTLSRIAVDRCNRLIKPPVGLLPGLQMALVHSDYTTVATAARTILRVKPNDPETMQSVTKLLREGVPRQPNDMFDRTAAAKGQAINVIAEFPMLFPQVRNDLISLLRTADSIYWPSVARAIAAIDSGSPKKDSIAP